VKLEKFLKVMKLEELDTDSLRKISEGKLQRPFNFAFRKPKLSKPKYSLSDLLFMFSGSENDKEICNTIKRTIEKLKSND